MAMMDQGEEIVDDGQNAAGEHFVDGVDVGSDARNQAAHGVGIEEANVHALHVAEDVAAQVEHDLLAGPLHQIGLDEFEKIGRNQRHQEDHGQPGDAMHGVGGQVAEEETSRSALMAYKRRPRDAMVGGEVAVDAHHDEVGAGDVAEGFERDGDGGNGCLPPVGAQVMAQAPDQARVVDLANRILVALGRAAPSRGSGSFALVWLVFCSASGMGRHWFQSLLYGLGIRVFCLHARV